MAKNRSKHDDEPEPLCVNCDSWTGNPLRLCLHIGQKTEPTDGCKKFFPDSLRWPDADHG